MLNKKSTSCHITRYHISTSSVSSEIMKEMEGDEAVKNVCAINGDRVNGISNEIVSLKKRTILCEVYNNASSR